MTAPRAVLLDALGTLVELEAPAPRLRAALVESCGIDVGLEAAERGFEQEIAYYLEHHVEGGDSERLEDLRERCAAVLHASLAVTGVDRDSVQEAMVGALVFRAFDDVPGALAVLRGRGLRLVAVSNWDCSLPYWLEQAGVLDLLDATLSSAEVGVAKPAPAVFERALGLAGVEAGEALHVGDSARADIDGARSAGIAAVLVDRDPAAVAADGVIRSLAELPSLI